MKISLTRFNQPFLLILLTISLTGYSQKKLDFQDYRPESITKQAEVQNKPIFLMYYATWCSHCNKMKNEVFSNPDVISFINNNFIIAGADGETEQGRKLKSQYAIKSYPNFLFLDKNGQLLYKISGEFTATELVAEAKNALNPAKQLPYLEKQFNADVSNPDKCLAYITTLLKGSNRQELSVPTHKYLVTQKENQLATAINWRIIANGVSDIESKEFQYVLKNREKFEKVASPARVAAKIKNIITESLTPSGAEFDSKEYEKKREAVAAINLPETNALLFEYDLKTGTAFKQWDFYKKITHENVQKMAWDNPVQLREISENYFENFKDKASLTTASEWMSRSLELSDSYDGRLLLAKLYNKSGNKDKAIATAKSARKFALDMGWDSKEADKLLEVIN